jgi:hypothetical protein
MMKTKRLATLGVSTVCTAFTFVINHFGLKIKSSGIYHAGVTLFCSVAFAT